MIWISTKDSIFIRACKGMEVERHPVWFMRQAGRYLPEYGRIKGSRNILEVQKDPEASSEITVLPVRELGVDAAILYSDIMVPVSASGFGIRIEENIGPVAERQLYSEEQIGGFKDFECESDAPYVIGNIKRTKEKLPDNLPLIGFSAAPFTLMSYLFEGKPSRTFERCKSIMKNDPDLWNGSMSLASELITSYLKSQLKAGVDAIQLFDSWAGFLSDEEYSKNALPYTKKIFASLPDNLVKIHFSSRNSGLLGRFAETGCNVLSVDHATDMRSTYETFGGRLAVQGNLDPDVARAGGNAMEIQTASILDSMDGVNGFIFNLGHGVLKDTNPDSLRTIVKQVKSRES